MSSDTYHLIRQRGDKFYLSMQFASDDAPMPIDARHDACFDSLDAAVRASANEYTEYGITLYLESAEEGAR